MWLEKKLDWFSCCYCVSMEDLIRAGHRFPPSTGTFTRLHNSQFNLSVCLKQTVHVCSVRKMLSIMWRKALVKNSLFKPGKSWAGEKKKKHELWKSVSDSSPRQHSSIQCTVRQDIFGKAWDTYGSIQFTHLILPCVTSFYFLKSSQL